MDKPALRRRIRRARQALSRGYRLDAMRAIARHASRLLKRGKRVGAYLAAGSELDLEILMSVALWRGAEVYLPQIPRRGRRLWFSRLGAADRWYLHPRYRIAEYDGPALRAERLDVLFVPLLAIDDDGYRMGQGGGFTTPRWLFVSARASSANPCWWAWPTTANASSACRASPGTSGSIIY